MAQRICFLGRGGSGKSTVAQNLGHALALKGYHVLLVGNDISLSSTVLLRGEADISPALEDYREHYEIDLNDYVIPTPSGVYCLELGSIDPGVGCLARGQAQRRAAAAEPFRLPVQRLRHAAPGAGRCGRRPRQGHGRMDGQRHVYRLGHLCRHRHL